MISKISCDLELASWVIEFEKSHSRNVQMQIVEACQCSAIEAHKRASVVINAALEKIQIEKRKNQLYVTSVLQKLVKYEVDSINTNMSKNFGLSESDFNLIVSQLKVNETNFFERMFVSHFSDCCNYIQTNYKANYDDAYDATMDAIVDFRERMVQQKIRYGNLRYLFTKMASQIYFKKQKAFRNREIKESDLPFEELKQNDYELSVLKKSWSELGDACQDLLKNHFYGNLKLTEIAEMQDKSSATVRKQKERCMNRLRLLFTKNDKSAEI